jgi:hypothetical protein
MTIDDLKEQAERNDNGDLVHETEYTHKQGHTVTERVNLTKLLNPGQRTTGDVDILVHEARQAESDRHGPENPAWPTNGDIANEAIQKIVDEGLTPAWKDSDVPGWDE